MESESDDPLRNESHLDHRSLPPLIGGACGYAVPGNHQLNSMLTESGSMRKKKESHQHSLHLNFCDGLAVPGPVKIACKAEMGEG
jgi:hypothetical protein